MLVLLTPAFNPILLGIMFSAVAKNVVMRLFLTLRHAIFNQPKNGFCFSAIAWSLGFIIAVVPPRNCPRG